MTIREIQEASDRFGIDSWGNGYYSINQQGHVVCHPTGSPAGPGVDLQEVVKEAVAKGAPTPLILRFPQIISTQLGRLHKAFDNAIREYEYDGRHQGVFPFKVNQRKEFIDQVTQYGRSMDYGLEVGSKTEFLAALSYDMAAGALLICNGFKDDQFIDLGFHASSMGKKVVLVIEGPDELEHIVRKAAASEHCPDIGIRAKLYSRGSGKWARSSGESSKFGLTTLEVLRCLKIIDKAGLSHKFTMMHFHIGSQITEIKRVKNAIKEASRLFCKIRKMGMQPTFMNIGGGIGVDYDGSNTAFHSSANYSLQEFANDVVYEIGEVCKNEGVACPHIVTESGRVIAAYHSIVITDIREIQGTESKTPMAGLDLDFPAGDVHDSLQELRYILQNINSKNYSEYYHDAIDYYEEMFTLFNLGYVSLEERAIAEQYYYRICQKALDFSVQAEHQPEEFEELQLRMVSKYLANFSIFQSIPDSWAINHLFPVMPLSRHHERPTLKATIVDITCDSDGCLERFIDRRDVKHVLDLHEPGGESYFLGFFLVGAYQESLSNEHNLLGAINEAEIRVHPDGSCEITKVTGGDPIGELLEARNYDTVAMADQFRQQLNSAADRARIKPDRIPAITDQLEAMMNSLPYLGDQDPDR